MKEWKASRKVWKWCLLGLFWFGINQVAQSQCSELTLTAQVQSATCGILNDGKITLQVQGGVKPYTYDWNNGAKSSIVSGLSEGVYTVNVSDASGCTTTLTQEVSVQKKLKLTTNIIPPSTTLASDGTLKIKVEGGVGPYTFQITDYSDIQNIKRFKSQHNEISGLKAGRYAIDAIDATGCVNTVMVLLNGQNQ